MINVRCEKILAEISDKVIILDGGLAAELAKDGFKIDDDPLWTARLLSTCPDAIKRVHRRFLDAGSDVIITASYQASIPAFMEHCQCSEENAKKYIKLSVSLAKEAREEFVNDLRSSEGEKESRAVPLIAGSVGPYGACQHDGSEYSGSYVDTMSSEALKEWHRPRIKILVESGIDILAVETIPALKEALAIAEVVQEFPNTKGWITFSCKDAESICHGENFSDGISAVVKFNQIFGIGINCTHPEFVEPLLQNIKSVEAHIVRVVYPNSGESWESGQWIGGSYKKKLVEFAPSWVAAGAKWIGGCCRTTPEDIRSLRQFLEPKH